MSKKILIILIGILVILSVIGIYTTFAADASVNTTNSASADIGLTFTLTDNATKNVTVKANSTKALDLNITNPYNGPVKYAVVYTSNNDLTNVEIGKLEGSTYATSATIPSGSTYPITILINNNSSSNVTISLTLLTGYEHGGDLVIPSGYSTIAGELSRTCGDMQYEYTGAVQVFTAKCDGYYNVEAWGAKGGGESTSGKGGYTSGKIYLTKGEKLYVYVGSKGNDANSNTQGGYNGGGSSTAVTGKSISGPSGGGATDIRYFSSTPSDSDLAWNSTLGLNSRIMVAAGGGGGNVANYSSGGGLFGVAGNVSTYTYYSELGKGATATAGGLVPTKDDCGGGLTNGTAGSFGIGGTGGKSSSTNATNGGGGAGGGGYYGGSGASGLCNGTFAGGGGSSFISGYAGSNAITSSSSRTHTNDTIHYSGKYFINGSMQTGNNSGNGKARITFDTKDTTLTRINTTLNGVRYIKDCANGNSVNNYNTWVEIQAIYNGTNIAKGKSGTLYDVNNNSISQKDSSRAFTYVTDGRIDNVTSSSGYGTGSTSSGHQCFVIDLGSTYNLDEIAVWHYFADERTSYDNVTYVSSDNKEWKEAININDAETSQGKRVSAYETKQGTGYSLYDKAGEYTYTVPTTGTYKLEVWGAQGATGGYGDYVGGYGGYSTGNISITSGTTIYINVGGFSSNYQGGYNGGGNGNYSSGYTTEAGGGGGATHIATVSGLLSTLSSSQNNLLIVAGAGGGSSYSQYGGDGGGYKGVNGASGSNYKGTGGSQTTGGYNQYYGSYSNSPSNTLGTFGKGGNADSLTASSYSRYYAGGGGGGYYGGGGGAWSTSSSSSSSSYAGGGGGGSGYIGNTNLTNKYMYCYNCSTSSTDSTKTYSTTNKSQSPVSDYAKKGTGAARITFLG